VFNVFSSKAEVSYPFRELVEYADALRKGAAQLSQLRMTSP
jgi:hypothetical protein